MLFAALALTIVLTLGETWFASVAPPGYFRHGIRCMRWIRPARPDLGLEHLVPLREGFRWLSMEIRQISEREWAVFARHGWLQRQGPLLRGRLVLDSTSQRVAMIVYLPYASIAWVAMPVASWLGGDARVGALPIVFAVLIAFELPWYYFLLRRAAKPRGSVETDAWLE